MIILKCIFLILVFIIGEVIASYVFHRIKLAESPDLIKKPSANRVAFLKGILERLFLYIGLLLDYPVVIVALSALKLGTRLKDHQESRVSNDYFLIGNLCSILFALLYAGIARILVF